MTEREEGERERRDRRSRGVPCHHCLATPCRMLKGRGSIIATMAPQGHSETLTSRRSSVPGLIDLTPHSLTICEQTGHQTCDHECPSPWLGLLL